MDERCVIEGDNKADTPVTASEFVGICSTNYGTAIAKKVRVGGSNYGVVGSNNPKNLCEKAELCYGNFGKVLAKVIEYRYFNTTFSVEEDGSVTARSIFGKFLSLSVMESNIQIRFAGCRITRRVEEEGSYWEIVNLAFEGYFNQLYLREDGLLEMIGVKR
ncbi:hypothetical protein [Shimazuella alba]|uniref:Uncharacterized protein n=1 Tax=Shimazuella alba TaxID=2690964 RepID=A0A6I4VSJ5_9BACL|nr:hypothetical protein [Shimazuella alba]MXQ53993.1 hypothetical protein [Shimazuella alba]